MRIDRIASDPPVKTEPQLAPIERQRIDVDIACVGFGPAMGGFLTTLSRELADGSKPVESVAMPGMPLQVTCYERADDLGFGVSGVVTRARAIRESFPKLDISQIPMAAEVREEKLIYLLDPHGASRRSRMLRITDRAIGALKKVIPFEKYAVELPYTPSFLRKHDGLVLSIGQFNQWVGSQLMTDGTMQIWPGMPVAEPLFEGRAVIGIRLADQGVASDGSPLSEHLPGMDVRAQLTVVGDGPVGAVGRALDARLGMPAGHELREWALGTKMVIELPVDCPLEAGTVFHTFGYPEPEIFGFLYVHHDRLASVGIFVPSWLPNPTRTSYRYLQHYIQHPYIWRYLNGGTLRSWGAKSLQESGRTGEPFLAGDGFARIGEGSGSTNVLTGSGVDEAWATGSLLAEAVVELLRIDKPFTRENLERSYVRRRRESLIDRESKIAEHARNGFSTGLITGLIGMFLAGITRGKVSLDGTFRRPHEQIGRVEQFYEGWFSPIEIAKIEQDAAKQDLPLHDALMNHSGWPSIVHDGRLLMSHQDVLLVGGKVQAAPGYADHVSIKSPALCLRCRESTCVSMCSGQAITRHGAETPAFDREKCVHCGACLWNCPRSADGEHSNIEFNAGAGGLHSAEN